MTVRPFIPLAATICTMALSLPAFGTQLYKWVDERGVTNYSDQPPAAAAKNAGVVDNARVSVYTPDPLLVQAVEAERARALDDLRTGRRARELQEDWLARQYFAAAHAPGYAADPCEGGADPRCGGAMPFGYAYAPAVANFKPRHGLRILPQVDLKPGATAGTVTGSRGYIPGYSAFAPRVSVTAPRAVLEGPSGGTAGHGKGGSGYGGGGRGGGGTR